MTSYFSMKWSSILPRSTFVQEASGSSLSGSDDIALDTFKQSSKPMLEDAVPRLSDEDPFRCLLVEQSTLRDDILLRVLRFNEMNVSKATHQLETTLNWRAHSRICSVGLDMVRGSSSGIPLARLCEPNEKGDALFFASAGLYDRSSIERAVQKVGVARMFEHMLYDSNGPKVRRGTVVVDFTGFGTKNVDVNGLRVGMATYMNHYPEIFDKIFLANYPRLLYGVWRTIVPLLDKRTARRVVFVETKEHLKGALVQRFSEKQIPGWLGGKAEVSTVRLLNGIEIGTVFHNPQLYKFKPIFAPNAGPSLPVETTWSSFHVPRPTFVISVQLHKVGDYGLSSGGLCIYCAPLHLPSFEETRPMTPTPRVASLGDASLSVDDLALLVPPCWMNDQLISFWCEHLRIHVLENDSRVAILPPNLSFFMSLTDDHEVLSQIASANNLKDSELIILTVNDSRDSDVDGNVASGTHWSLLALDRQANVAYYLDSLPHLTNVKVSQVLLHRLARMLGTSKASFVELDTPRQRNSYDCGAYACKFAEDVVQCFLSKKQISSVYEKGTELHQDQIDQKRQEIGKLACRLLPDEAVEVGPQQSSPQ